MTETPKTVPVSKVFETYRQMFAELEENGKKGTDEYSKLEESYNNFIKSRAEQAAATPINAEAAVTSAQPANNGTSLTPENTEKINQATGSLKSHLVGVGEFIGGVSLLSNANHNIKNETEQTSGFDWLTNRLQFAGGAALSTDGALRATTGKGAGYWVQKVTEGAQSAAQGISK